MKYKRIKCRYCNDGVLVAWYSKKKVDTCYRCGQARRVDREAKKMLKAANIQI